MYREILFDVAAPAATITLNRPERLNAFTARMGDELRDAVARAEADSDVVAIVITGAGRGFSAGADLTGLQRIGAGEHGRRAAALGSDPADPPGRPGHREPGDPAEPGWPGDPKMGASFRGPYSYLLSVRKPVIAAINGPVAGMAFAIALFCDLRFASDRAVFTTAFSRRGLIAEWGIAWTLPRLVGPAHALDLLFSARRVDAAFAERIGLVNRVVPHDELVPFTASYVKELAEQVSPTSMAIMKRQVWTSCTGELGDAMSEAIRLMGESFERPDFAEGVESFLQKRPPRFPGI